MGDYFGYSLLAGHDDGWELRFGVRVMEEKRVFQCLVDDCE